MTEDDAKQKLCPVIGRNCVAPDCMAWKVTRRILPYHITLSEAIQKKYKGIEIIQYDGLSILTILGGECKLYKYKER